MKAIGYQQSLPCDDPYSLVDATLPEPVPGPYDLLVAVKAIAVNPVDTKDPPPPDSAPWPIPGAGLAWRDSAPEDRL